MRMHSVLAVPSLPEPVLTVARSLCCSLLRAGCVLLSAALAMQESVSVPSSADADAAAAKDEDGGALPTLTSWQGHGRGSRGRRLYVGMFIGAMSLCLACNTGAEHSMATWLPALGTEVGGLSAQRMAVIASTYWGVMCAGRLAWTALSGLVSSTWPMIFFDLCASLIASLLLVMCALWPAPVMRTRQQPHAAAPSRARPRPDALCLIASSRSALTRRPGPTLTATAGARW